MRETRELTRTAVAIAVMIAVLMGGGAADLRAQNLVQNGGFETGFRPTGAVANWAFHIDGCSGNAGDPSVNPGIGRTYASINGGPPEDPLNPLYDVQPITHTGYSDMWFGAPTDCHPSVYQTVVGTVAGQTYNLDFWLNLNSWAGWGGRVTPDNSFEVIVDGSILFNGLVTNYDWAASHYTFTATQNDILLEFVGSNNPTGTELDDVSVTAVPEPASLVLLATGLVGMAGVTRRRKMHG